LFTIPLLLLAFAFTALGQCDPEISAVKQQFRLATPAQRSTAILANLAEVRADIRITTEQRNLVNEIIPLIKPSLYTDGEKRTYLPAELFERIGKVFAADPSLLTRPREVVKSYFAKHLSKATFQKASFVPACECNSSWNTSLSPDCSSVVCNDWKTACVYSSWGCGHLWLYSCDRMCGQYIYPWP